MNNEGQGHWNKEILFFLLPAILFFSLVFIYPFIYGVYLSFTDTGGSFTLSNYVRFFTDMWEFRTVWVTFKIAMPVTILSMVLAIPLSYYMRFGLKYEKLITFFLVLPTTLGMVLVAEGILTYMGPKGWLNQFLMAIKLIDEPIQLIHNYWGVFTSLFIQNFPFAFLLLVGYVSGIDPNLEKASLMLGASKTQTFWKVMFPMLVPGAIMSFCITFASNFSVFSSAILLGAPSGPTRTMAYASYQWAYEKYDQNFGVTISIVMVVAQIIVIGALLLMRNKFYKGATMVGKE
jgi:putative spermidine/putrescine transport system permease protein